MMTAINPVAIAEDARYGEMCTLCARGVPVAKCVDGRYAHLGTLVCEASKLRVISETSTVDMEKLAWESHLAEQCPCCGTHKRKLDVFCYLCWKVIPKPLRADLRRPFKDGKRLVAFVEAMAFLRKKKLTTDSHGKH